MKSLFTHLTLVFILIGIGQRSMAIGLENEYNPKTEIDAGYAVPLINDFGIIGPEELCLYYGSIIGEFFGGGLATDVFKWKIIKADGSVLVDREGGFQTFSHTFSEVGVFDIQLSIRRGVDEVYSGTKKIIINKGADLVIENSYLLCDEGKATLTLLNPNTTNLSSFQIKWFDSSNKLVGTGNSIQVNTPDKYRVEFFTINEVGLEVCPFSINTYVYKPKEYKLAISNPEACDGGTLVTVSAGSSNFGKWYYQKENEDEKVFLSEGNKLEFTSSRNLDGPGNYLIIFEVDNSDNAYCKLTESIPYRVNVSPEVNMSLVQGSTDCNANDGVFLLVAETDIDLVRFRKDGIVIARYEKVKKGDEIRITGLKSGLYGVSIALGSCSKTFGALIPLVNVPSNLQFSIQEVVHETCDENGKINGKINVKLLQPNFSGRFNLLTTSGAIVQSNVLTNVQEFSISAPAGNYHIELTNGQGCRLPTTQRVIIQAKAQVVFSAPARLTICEYYDFTPTTNQNLEFTLTYPDGSKVTKNKGEAFRMDQSGEYFLLGMESDSQNGFCPRETSIFVTVNKQVQFDPELISKDCFGNKQYKANLFGEDPSRFNIKWINEKNEVVGTEELLFPISSGEFKLDVQPKNSETCPAPAKAFIIENTVLSVNVNLKASVLCPGSSSLIELATDLAEVKKIFWLFIDPAGNSSVLEQYEDKTEFTVQNPGTYEAVVFNEMNCEIGRNLITVVETTAMAAFQIPEEIIICDFLQLVPETELDLNFTLVNPNGEISLIGPGESVIFSQEGKYTLTAESADADMVLCTVTKTIQVKRTEPVNFEPQISEQTCDGKLIFEANLFGKSAAEVDIFWYNELGALVGNEQFLTPETYGVLILEVRPKGSYPCPAPNSKEFEVIKPIIAVEGSLSSTPFCSEGENVTVSLEADFRLVSKIQWYYRDFNGNLVWLKNFNGQREIVVSKEGTYEVEIFNKLGCTVGKDVLMVMRSMDESRPQVEETYLICPSLGSNQGINPGNFQKYEWILNGNLVSEEAVFSPTESGNYILTVTNSDGCAFSTAFEVLVECKVQVIHTTGMSTKDSQRPFRVYSNPLVDEIGVWIYNNWGQLVYQCNKQNLTAGNELCEWYGDFNGQTIETGTYAVKIIYKNNVENITKSIWSSVTVVD
jgi:hypothetical protein